MPVTYRRLIGRDVWHFHNECHHMKRMWRKAIVSRALKPRTGELCNECQAKARADKRRLARTGKP